MARPDRSNESIPKEVLEKLIAEHEDVLEVATIEGPVACKKPSRATYAQFNTLLWDEKRRSQASDYLVSNVVIYPDQKTYNLMVDKAPGIVGTISSKVLDFAGLDGNADAKKY